MSPPWLARAGVEGAAAISAPSTLVGSRSVAWLAGADAHVFKTRTVLDPRGNSDECAGVRPLSGARWAKVRRRPRDAAPRSLPGFEAAASRVPWSPSRWLAAGVGGAAAPFGVARVEALPGMAWDECPCRMPRRHATCARRQEQPFLCMCMSEFVVPLHVALCMLNSVSVCTGISATPGFEQQRGLCSNREARTHNTPKPQGGVRLVAGTCSATSSFYCACACVNSWSRLCACACLRRLCLWCRTLGPYCLQGRARVSGRGLGDRSLVPCVVPHACALLPARSHSVVLKGMLA